MKKISIIGFGKIGQAIGANILNHDIDIIAVDINKELISSFKNNSFSSNEPGLQKVLQTKFNKNKLIITDDFSKIESSDAIVIAIPLLVDIKKNIIEDVFLDCFKKIAPYCSNNILISIETSIPIGFARNKVLPLLESFNKKHGVDFLLIHSPERIKSGSMLEQLIKTPKIIGGIDDIAAQKGYDVYNDFFDSKILNVVDSIEAAEMVKLAGMVYRDINIALSNQLACFANKIGINYNKLIKIINTDGEANLLQPGIGVGGHCTPVYPYFLIDNFKENNMNFILAEEARKINDYMASYAVELIKDKVLSKKAVILGLGFRPDVKEDTFSTAYLLNNILLENRFEVKLFDPLYSIEELKAKGFAGIMNLYDYNAEIIFLITKHSIFNNINWNQVHKNGCRYFIDGRNAFDRKWVELSGINYIGIGQ